MMNVNRALVSLGLVICLFGGDAVADEQRFGARDMATTCRAAPLAPPRPGIDPTAAGPVAPPYNLDLFAGADLAPAEEILLRAGGLWQNFDSDIKYDDGAPGAFVELLWGTAEAEKQQLYLTFEYRVAKTENDRNDDDVDLHQFGLGLA